MIIQCAIHICWVDEWVASVILFPFEAHQMGKEAELEGRECRAPWIWGDTDPQSGASMFLIDFLSPQVSLLYPSINPAVEEPLQISCPQHISPPPEESMFCEIKEVSIDFSRRGEKGRTFTFIQLSLQQLSTRLGKFPHISQWIRHCQNPPFSLADRDGF